MGDHSECLPITQARAPSEHEIVVADDERVLTLCHLPDVPDNQNLTVQIRTRVRNQPRHLL